MKISRLYVALGIMAALAACASVSPKKSTRAEVEAALPKGYTHEVISMIGHVDAAHFHFVQTEKYILPNGKRLMVVYNYKHYPAVDLAAVSATPAPPDPSDEVLKMKKY